MAYDAGTWNDRLWPTMLPQSINVTQVDFFEESITAYMLNYTSHEADSIIYFSRIKKYLNMFVLPVLISLGLAGNGLAFMVFMCTHLKYQSSSIYLACLNVADTGFLMCVLISDWMGYIDLHITHVQGMCQIIVYSSYVFAFMSVWIVVSFTVERYIVVFYPLKKHQLCTPKRAKIVVMVLLGTALSLYLVTALTSVVKPNMMGKQMCQPGHEYQTFWYYFLYIDSLVTVIIPCVFIILFNVRISIRICEFIYKRRSKQEYGTVCAESGRLMTYNVCVKHNGKTLMITNSGVKSKASNSSSHRRSQTLNHGSGQQSQTPSCIRRSYQIRTTRALVIVSSVFLSLNFPSHVFRLYYVMAYTRMTPIGALWQTILQLLYYTNFAVNVFLYGACSNSFRAAFKALGKKWKHCLHTLCGKFDWPWLCCKDSDHLSHDRRFARDAAGCMTVPCGDMDKTG